MEEEAQVDADAGAGTNEQQQPPHNEDPAIIASTFSMVIQLLQQYGWFILLGVVAAVFIWNKLQKIYRQWQQSKEDSDLKKYDRNTAQRRLEAMELARQRLQEQYNSQAEEHAEKQKQKEEEKRKEKIEDWDRHLQGKGYRNKYKAPAEATPSSSQPKPKKKTPLRPTDYNPLMGAGGGGAAFRPGRRSGGG